MDHIVLAGDDDQAIYDWLGATLVASLSPSVLDDHKTVLAIRAGFPAPCTAQPGRLIHRLTAREAQGYRLRGAEGYLLQLLLRVLRRQVIPFHCAYPRDRWAWNPHAPRAPPSRARRVLAFLAPEQPNRLWDSRRALGMGGGALGRRGPHMGANPLTRESLTAFFEPPAMEAALACSLGWYRENLIPSQRRKVEFALAVAERPGAPMLAKSPPLTVGAIHSVKSGEADGIRWSAKTGPVNGSHRIEWSNRPPTQSVASRSRRRTSSGSPGMSRAVTSPECTVPC